MQTYAKILNELFYTLVFILSVWIWCGLTLTAHLCSDKTAFKCLPVGGHSSGAGVSKAVRERAEWHVLDSASRRSLAQLLNPASVVWKQKADTEDTCMSSVVLRDNVFTRTDLSQGPEFANLSQGPEFANCWCGSFQAWSQHISDSPARAKEPLFTVGPVSKSESCSVVSFSLWPHGLYSPWNSPGLNTGVDSLSIPQGIFPTPGSNSGFPHCRWILYQLSHKGSPRILEWVACPFSSGSSWLRNWTGVSCIAGRFFTN